MGKPKKKNKLKATKNVFFYRRWWFWLIMGLLFVGTWCFLLISDQDIKNSIIGVCGVWGSAIATVFIGIIACKQAEYTTFITHKQNLINEIKNNEIIFLSDICGLSSINPYCEYLISLIYSSPDEDVLKQSLPRVIQKTQIVETIHKFILVSQAYQYCPVTIPKLRDKCEELKKFVVEQMVEENFPDPAKDPDGFKQRGRYLSNQLMAYLKEINKLRVGVTAEMQFLINEVSKKKSLKDIIDFENCILEKTRKVREELLGVPQQPK